MPFILAQTIKGTELLYQHEDYQCAIAQLIQTQNRQAVKVI